MTSSVYRRTVAVGLGAASALALSAGSASAAPTGDYAPFAKCPFANPAVASCLYSETTSGTFKLGNATVPINKKIVLQGGYATDPVTFENTFYNATGGPTLSPTPLKVPGGLTGIITPAPTWSAPLRSLFAIAVNSVNDVTATAELVGPVSFSFLNFAVQSGAAVKLPVRIKLDNPFLGDNCYVGSASNPVRLNLTTGTTAPPAPNTPISGATGALDFPNDGNLIVATGTSLVDNSFSVPAAANCGPLGFSGLINLAVNLKEGFPSAAGKNSAVLNGNVKVASAAAVAASAN